MAVARRTSLADSDLVDIWVYIAQDNLAAADRMIERLVANHETLAQFPQLGEEYQARHRVIRRFVVGNYVTFYAPVPGGVLIYRVLHGSRKMDELL